MRSIPFSPPDITEAEIMEVTDAQIWGTAAGNFSYFLAMIGGGLLMHRLWRKIRRKRHEESARDV